MNNTHSKFKFWFGGALGLLGALAASADPALASDGKIMPGSMCRPLTSNNILVSFSGFAYNGGGSVQTAICPLFVDTTGSLDDERSQVRVRDSSSTDSVECFVEILNAGSLSYRVGDSTDDSFIGDAWLDDFNTVTDPAFSYDQQGQVRCRLPSGSRVYSYQFAEND